MYRAIKPDPHHLRDAARIVAISLVDLRLQHRPHMPGLNTDHRQIGFRERTEQPLRQRSSFQSNPLEAISRVPQYRQQSLRFARDPPSRLILPASSTMQTLVSLTETSSPAK